MSEITHRWMTGADIPALIPLAHRIWHAHYPSIISVDQIDYMLATRYTPENLIQQMDAGQRFLLAVKDEKMIGFASAGPLSKVQNATLRGEPKAGPHDYFLYKCYLAPELQGQGIGSGLLSELEGGLAAERLRLQVARANVNSWNFYQRRGFAIVAEIDFDIGQGYKMLDYVMEKSLE